MFSKKGIDVSKHNGKIDFSKVKQSGIDFAICRAGYGNSVSQKDTTFDYNVQNALANGIEVGAYWFSYALSTADAIKEADVFLKILEPYKGKFTMPVCFDFEYDSIRYAQRQGVNMTNKLITDIAVAFMDKIKNAGWCVANYTNLDFIRNKFNMSKVKFYDLWLADYTGSPDIPCCIQQTASNGRVNGICGNVDINITFVDYKNIIVSGGLNGYPKPSDFTCDTTMDISLKRGQAYQFKVTSNVIPKVTVGTSNVVTLLSRYNTGNNHFYYLVGVGNPKDGAGIFVNNEKQFVVNMK